MMVRGWKVFGGNYEFHLSMLLPPLLPAKAYNWFSALFSGGYRK